MFGGPKGYDLQLLWAVVMVMVGGFSIPIWATERNLYQATTFVTGQREETRTPGILACFTEVLIKVSGDPCLTTDRRFSELRPSAEATVVQYSYRDRMTGIPVHDEQGTRDRPYDLTVLFDPPAIEAALAKVGRVPWKGPRPTVLVLVAVETSGEPYVLTRDGARGIDQRDALDAVSRRVGVPVILPTEADLATLFQPGPSTVDSLRVMDKAWTDAATDLHADAVLKGRLVWDVAALGWMVDWVLFSDAPTMRMSAPHWSVEKVTFDDGFRSGLGGTLQILSGHAASDGVTLCPFSRHPTP